MQAAYEYENQRWVQGAEAEVILLRQYLSEIATIEQGGERYLAFIRVDKTPAQAIADIRSEVVKLNAKRRAQA